jgi:hypothetical protein
MNPYDGLSAAGILAAGLLAAVYSLRWFPGRWK